MIPEDTYTPSVSNNQQCFQKSKNCAGGKSRKTFLGKSSPLHKHGNFVRPSQPHSVLHILDISHFEDIVNIFMSSCLTFLSTKNVCNWLGAMWMSRVEILRIPLTATMMQELGCDLLKHLNTMCIWCILFTLVVLPARPFPLLYFNCLFSLSVHPWLRFQPPFNICLLSLPACFCLLIQSQPTVYNVCFLISPSTRSHLTTSHRSLLSLLTDLSSPFPQWYLPFSTSVHL